MAPPGATLIPHPPIVWEQIRVHDIWILLVLGAAAELVFRLIVLQSKRKPSELIKREDYYYKLEHDVKKKQALGPSAFVETSKLERQLLALDKELQEVYSQRKSKTGQLEKYCLKYGRNVVAFIVFLVYYGVPLVTFSGGGQELLELDSKIPATFHKAVLFPLSIVGFGFKLSKWGMAEEVKATSIGALVVLWAGQVTMGQIMDGVDSLLLS
jgi:hypothetical protein